MRREAEIIGKEGEKKMRRGMRDMRMVLEKRSLDTDWFLFLFRV